MNSQIKSYKMSESSEHKTLAQTKIDQLVTIIGVTEEGQQRLLGEMKKLLSFSTSHMNRRRKLTWAERRKSFTNFEMLLLSKYWSRKLGKPVTINDLLNEPPDIEEAFQSIAA
jgi:hypothetical protein